MSDDDMIRRGDVLKAVYDAMAYSNRVPLTFVQKRIRALPAVQPRVKPLVWTAFSKECLRAESIFGIYELMWGFKNGQAFLSSPHLCRIDTWHPDIEFAKAYAVTDYEARILSALEPAVQPDAAAILQERPDSLDRVARAICLASYGAANPVPVPDELMPNAWERLRDRYALLAEAAILALIDNSGKDTIATLYGALAQRQQPLGAEFQAAIFSDVDSLYDNSPGKEVMPDKARTTRAAHDTGPGDQAVAGAAQDAILYGTGFMQGGKHVSPEDILAEPPPWPEGLIHLTNTRRFHVDCATEGCGRRVSTRFEGRDYCEPCGRKVALAQKGDSHE
jgi:hypothetical protein